MNRSGGDSPWRAFVLVHGVGIQVVVTILIGLYGGRLLDKHFHTSPWLMIIGLLAGVLGGIYSAIKLMKAFLGDRR